MKKSTLAIIILEILLIVVTVGYNTFGIGQPKNIEYTIQKELKGNEVASLNYILKYEMPANFQEDADLEGEIAISYNGLNAMFVAEPSRKEDMSIEEFFETQNDILGGILTSQIVYDDSYSIEDKKINKKVLKIENDFVEFYIFLATIEFDNNEDEFIGLIGNALSRDFEKDFDLLLNSIQYTSQKIDKERLFSDDLEEVSVSVPANWKKFKRNFPYNFIKEDKDSTAFAIITSSNLIEEDAEQDYQLAKDSFLEIENAKLIEDSIVTTSGNKTITSSIIEFPENNAITKLCLIKFNNSDVYVAFRADIIGNENKDETMKELDFMINSLKLK